MGKQKGQVVLILLLVMTVGLAIGLSVIQRSITDISTASKVEQSSRAFSAAEAGIEKALRNDFSGASFPEIGATASIEGPTDLLPVVPSSGQRQAPLEYPPLAKEEVAQVWLADYNSAANPPPTKYNQTSLDIYWGSSTSDKAALEITLIYYEAASYKVRKWYLDHPITRTPDNKFEQVACSGYTVGANQYQCQKTLGSLPAGLMLARARLLYNSTSQPFAVQGVGICGTSCSLPPQSKNITSTGISGETQRKVRVFQLNKVVPPYLDYAIFSVGEIGK